jgi:hypothetical protein
MKFRWKRGDREAKETTKTVRSMSQELLDMTGCKTTGCLFRVEVMPKRKAWRAFTCLADIELTGLLLRSDCEVVALPVGESDGVVAGLVALYSKTPNVQNLFWNWSSIASRRWSFPVYLTSKIST